MPWLADTSIVLRVRHHASPERPVINQAVASLLDAGESVFVSTQNLIEFRNVATRPLEARGGFGMSPEEADRELAALEAIFTIAPDNLEVYEIWKRLVSTHAVRGLQVHDARIAAVMMVHGIENILTLNPDDFRRYPGITPVTPTELLAQS